MSGPVPISNVSMLSDAAKTPASVLASMSSGRSTAQAQHTLRQAKQRTAMRHFGEAEAAIAVGVDRHGLRKMARPRGRLPQRMIPKRLGCSADLGQVDGLLNSAVLSLSSESSASLSRLLTDAQIDQDRRRDEDRGVGADQHDAEHHGRREGLDRPAAEQQQRQQRPASR